MILGLIVGLVVGSVIAAVAVAGIAAGAREDALLDHERGVSAQIEAAVQMERKQTARWRDRALLCEEKGPTCGEVDEVFKENVRLKAEIAVLKEPPDRKVVA